MIHFGEPTLSKLTWSLLFISLLMFSHAEAVQGATGSRLKSRTETPSDIAALQIEDRRQGTHFKLATVQTFQTPRQADQDAQITFVAQFPKRQDMKGVRKTSVRFLEDPERLRRHLSHKTQRSAFELCF